MKKFDANDPLLTAFALGELEGQEAIEMAKLVENDPEAKKFVEEIRQTAEHVTLELEKTTQQEPPMRLLPEQRNVIFEKAVAQRSSWRPWFLFAPAAGLAAAVIAVLMVGKPFIKTSLDELKSGSAPIAQTTSDQGKLAGLQQAPAQNEPSDGSPVKDTGTEKPQTIAEAPAEPVQAELAADESMMEMADDVAADAEAPVAASQAAMAPPPPPAAAAPKTMTSPKQGGSIKSESAPGYNVTSKKRDTSRSGVYSIFGARQQVGTSGSGELAGFAGAGAIEGKKGYMGAEQQLSRERYSYIKENSFIKVVDEALSTFSIDVDTASYSNVRRMLTAGQMPPPDAVRIEEMLNYFKYDYPQPKGNEAFSVTTEVTTAPWAPKNKLVRIGLKGKDVAEAKRPASNLVFLLDVSGSMNDPAKLPLLKSSLKLLVDRLRDNDKVAIIVYAGSEGIVLESTPGTKKAKIMDALDKLEAGGSTNGEAGIQAAYKMAEKNFIKGGVNRVILATDGDFNVGTTSEGELERLIENKAKSGVFLTVLGFGTGNYNDSTMTKLAGKGNGNAAYIDTIKEAHKVLVEQAGGTLQTIAKDVKIQVEFNPKHVQAYRLIGYEKRMLAKEDFNDDTKDAGEIGAGHTVTALYEIVPPGVEIPKSAPKVDELKYQKNEAKPTADSQTQAASGSDELMTVKLRFKKPDGKTSDKIEVPVTNETKAFEASSPDMKFAAAVAGFGMILRNSELKGSFGLDEVIELTLQNSRIKGKTDDTRLELIELARKTRDLQKKNK